MSAEEKLSIEAYEDNSGESPIEEFLRNLPAKDFKYIIDKRAYFQKYSVSQLKNSRYLENIRGATELWELKFHWRTEYRAVCIIRENKIVMLDMFKGSGSAGRGVTKYIPKCLQRAKDWNERYP